MFIPLRKCVLFLKSHQAFSLRLHYFRLTGSRKLLKLSCIMLQNGQTYFKNLAVFAFYNIMHERVKETVRTRSLKLKHLFDGSSSEIDIYGSD